MGQCDNIDLMYYYQYRIFVVAISPSSSIPCYYVYVYYKNENEKIENLKLGFLDSLFVNVNYMYTI